MCSPISRMRALGVRVRVLRVRILASCCGGRIAEIGLGVAAVSSESDPGSEFPTRFGMPSGSCEERTLEGVVLRSRLVASISCTNSRGERKDPCTSPDRSLACKGAAACGSGCPESLGGPGFLWMPTRGGAGVAFAGRSAGCLGCATRGGAGGGCVASAAGAGDRERVGTASAVGGGTLATILESDGRRGSACGGAKTKILC